MLPDFHDSPLAFTTCLQRSGSGSGQNGAAGAGAWETAAMVVAVAETAPGLHGRRPWVARAINPTAPLTAEHCASIHLHMLGLKASIVFGL